MARLRPVAISFWSTQGFRAATSDAYASSAATFDGIVSRDLLHHPLLRSAIAVVAVLWLLGGAVEHSRHAAVSLDGAHGLIASASGALAVNGDHVQGDCGLSLSCPELAAVVVLPQWDTAFLALGMLGAAAAVVCWSNRTRETRRGPPRGSFMAITGQDLLTRFCLARR